MNLSMPDLSNLTWAGVGDWLVGTPLLIITVVVVGLLARFVLHRLINRVVATATSRRAERLASIPGAGRALQAVRGRATCDTCSGPRRWAPCSRASRRSSCSASPP